jgi:hypothetical protein
MSSGVMSASAIVAGVLPKTPASTADKERAVGGRGNVPRTLPTVMDQRRDGTRMQGQLARLGELGLPDGQHPMLEIDIGIAQVNGFRDAQTGRSHQAEQRLEGGRTQAAARPELAGRRQQFDDFLFAVDVRRHASRFRAED